VELGNFLWESRGRLAGWGWTSDLNLVVVEDTGRAALYTLHGRRARELSLGAAVEAQVCVCVCVCVCVNGGGNATKHVI